VTLDLASSLRHYCIVRKDLPRGVIAAQLIHAAGESSPGDLPEGTIAVALEASPQKLHQLEERLTHDNIPHKAIREPDAPWNGELMAIGVHPDSRDKLKKYFSQLPLVR
jgi:peptidyl-tRNA hydrolase